ncbi:hypothetical protein L2750_03805 [Shewanella submarina]|uniref:Uncharacterized protein n=1 Tax=Shewanella submarina TaxID=2016376 RepID=A0ABV7GLL9_9GAMM|nr:hypothetical protein [Shewanella submarina]MCL1036274.1 hypothetical protein [Shewanella submarina]
MKKVIPAEFGFKLKSHRTFRESVSSVDSVKEKILEKINGEVLISFEFNGEALSLQFKNELFLNVKVGLDAIEWQVSEIPDVTTSLSEQSNILFQFENDVRIEWDILNILEGFIGKQVAVSPSDQLLFIFTKGGVEYMFSSACEMGGRKKSYLCLGEV